MTERDAMLLALKMEARATSRGMQGPQLSELKKAGK